MSAAESILTDLKLKVAKLLPEKIVIFDDDKQFRWRSPMACPKPILDTEWPHIVDEMIRTKLPAEKRDEFLGRLWMCDPADLTLRYTVQHWWALARCYFEVMEAAPTREGNSPQSKPSSTTPHPGEQPKPPAPSVRQGEG
jgi:hypothetical protein